MSALSYLRGLRRRIIAPASGRVQGKVRLALVALGVLAAMCTPVKSAALTPYPLTTCIVTGDKLSTDAIVFSYDGREIKTCCTDCIDEFYKDPARFAGKIDEEAARAEKK